MMEGGITEHHRRTDRMESNGREWRYLEATWEKAEVQAMNRDGRRRCFADLDRLGPIGAGLTVSGHSFTNLTYLLLYLYAFLGRP